MTNIHFRLLDELMGSSSLQRSTYLWRTSKRMHRFTFGLHQLVHPRSSSLSHSIIAMTVAFSDYNSVSEAGEAGNKEIDERKPLLERQGSGSNWSLEECEAYAVAAGVPVGHDVLHSSEHPHKRHRES
jgi:hypothetical protein